MTCYRVVEFPQFKTEKKQKKTRNYRNEAKSESREVVLDRWFSRFIRLRDCPDNSSGFGRCVSCGKAFFWKEAHNGHYCHRDKKPTRWDEKNCHLQCVSCNSYHGGKEAEHRDAMVGMYGEAEVIEIENRSREPYKKMLHEEIEGLIAFYKTKAKEEAERLGVEI